MYITLMLVDIGGAHAENQRFFLKLTRVSRRRERQFDFELFCWNEKLKGGKNAILIIRTNVHS